MRYAAITLTAALFGAVAIATIMEPLPRDIPVEHVLGTNVHAECFEGPDEALLACLSQVDAMLYEVK